MNSHQTENPHLILLELNDELKQEEIVTKFGIDKRSNSLVLSLNHKYKEKNIVFSVPSVDKIDWTTFTHKFINRLNDCGIQKIHISMLDDVLQTNYETILGLSENTAPNSDIKNKQKESVLIRKYTAKSLLPLHEAVVFANTGQSAFVYLDNEGKPVFGDRIERSDKTLYPADNLDSQNPLPYTFASTEELERYLQLAKQETFDSLYQRVKSVLRKYVNVDEHYLTVIAADIIYSYFQDKFSTVHYDIFVGDNGSGKNSALLVISRLAYRVYYLVSASAPNYFTFYGNIEECQGTIAEDEVGDLDKDFQKQKVLKSGYTSGGTVPKIDFPNGKRSQVAYTVYGMKWFAMEERPDSRKTKGIFDRSFIFNFIIGHVDYNIKDVIKNAGDPKFKPLYDELVHIHKLLFASRLVRYNDIVPDIQINIENRNAELTKPSLRLFLSRDDAPVAVDEIRLALSKFIAEKNELRANSIESKMCEALNDLSKERSSNPDSDEYKGLEDYAFTNDQIWAKCRLVMGGADIFGKSESFYSIDYGVVTHKRISGLYQSKFKAVSFKTHGDNSKRGWRFQKEVLERIALQYKNEDEIKIMSDSGENQGTEQSMDVSSQEPDKDNKTASDASDASHYKNPYGVFNENNKSTVHESYSADDKSDSASKSSTDTVKPLNFVENNDNSVLIKSSTENNSDNNPISKSDLPVLYMNSNNTNQIKLYSNTPYTPCKSDASDASDAYSATKPSQNLKLKAEQVGLPEIPCTFCDYKDPIEFDLSLHYLEKHRQNLIRLPIGKGSIDKRADYAVELSKKRLAESFDDDDDDRDDDGDENESDE